MKCPKCNAELREGAKFCTKCGEKIVQQSEQKAEQQPVCAKCGTPLKPGAKFCTKCGTKVAAAAPAPVQEPKAPQAAQDMQAAAGRIYWNIQPGLVARVISEAEGSEFSLGPFEAAYSQDMSAWDAVKEAKHPRIHVFLATSDIHMEYKLQMTREQVLQRISEMVAYARSFCEDIEFSAEDASRSEWAFLAQCYSDAVAAGATTLNVPDTVGYSTPQEMSELITYLRQNVAGIENVDISVHCHNDLGMAVANSLACVKAGATQIECTVNGIGERAGNASLEELVMAIHTRRDFYDAETGINTKQIYRSSKLLSNITGVPIPPSKAIVGANAFAHESGIHQHGVLANALTYEIMTPSDVGIPQNTMVLGKHSGKHALRDKLQTMGYELTDAELEKVFARFKTLADKKKNITTADIEALVLHRHNANYETCQLVSHVINAGDGVPNTSCVKLKRAGEELEEVAIGSGPLDASFKAINRMLGLDVKLDSFSLNAVTEGEDAIGEAVVKIEGPNGRRYTGTGLSTDIIESSIRAYVNGINKMMESTPS